MEALLAATVSAAISSGLTLIGTIYTVNASQKKTQTAVETTMKTEMAVMNTRIDNLTQEVERHNNFAVKIPMMEARGDRMEQAIHRLENFHME